MSIPTLTHDRVVVGADQSPNSFRNCIKGQVAANHYLNSHGILKQRAERRMVAKAVALLPSGASILDAPCGNGRVMPAMAAHGLRITGLDFSPHCVGNCQQAVAAYGDQIDVLQGDLARLPFEARSFDGVLCFRFYHHLSDEADRNKLVGELCRVSERFVFLSYLSPFSPGSVRRKLKRMLFSPEKRGQRKTATLRSVVIHFENQGFALRKNIARMPLFHSLYLACFERQ